MICGIAPELAHGLFFAPGSYDALLRFSVSTGDILDDSVSAPRGLAIKLFGVSGGRLRWTWDGGLEPPHIIAR